MTLTDYQLQQLRKVLAWHREEAHVCKANELIAINHKRLYLAEVEKRKYSDHMRFIVYLNFLDEL